MGAAFAALFGMTLVTGNLIGITLTLFGLLIMKYMVGGNYVALGDGLWNIFNNFVLTALPVFIFLGEILAHSGVSKRIYSSISPLFSRLPGRLLQTNIGSCTMFSAVCGSSQATAAVVGAIAFEELEQRGYRARRIAGSIAAGGTLGILVPPSLALIIYGFCQDVSVGSLFLAGVIPGLMIAAFFMVYVGVSSTLHPEDLPAQEEPVPLWDAIKASLNVWPFFVLVFAILGTLILGLATPTESAALGVATALVLAVLYRELTLAVLWQALMSTVRVFGTISLIIVGATVLSQALALSGIPSDIARWVARSGMDPVFVLLSVYAIYLVLGCLLAAIEMLLITLPFTFPLIVGLGYDPVWFGIAVVLLIEVGMLTPPLGMNLFIIMAVSGGRLPLGEIVRGCVPYWFILLGSLAILTAFPAIVLYLPRLVMGG